MNNWQTFLFDFDGTLVESEPLHYLAYLKTCEEFGFALDKDLTAYCLLAHHSAHTLKEYLKNKYLFTTGQELDWQDFYLRKKKIVAKIIATTELSMVKGAEVFLQTLLELEKNIAVVTNSSLALVELFKERIPLLKEISCWITREDYQLPKPSPESYLIALKKFEKTKAIGFEDSIKGMQALLNAQIEAVMVNASVSKENAQDALNTEKFAYFSSFDEVGYFFKN